MQIDTYVLKECIYSVISLRCTLQYIFTSQNLDVAFLWAPTHLCHHNNRVKVIFRFWSVVKLNESWKYILIVVIISSALLDTFCKRNLREGDSHIQRIRHVSHGVTVSVARRCLRYVIISKVNFAKQDLTTGKQRLRWFGRRQAADSSFKARWRLNQQTIGPNDAGDVATDSSLRWS